MQVQFEIADDTETTTSWVSAAPFRAWLEHLSADSGYDPVSIAVAAGVPTAVARSLTSNQRLPRRIRAVDAQGLLAVNTKYLTARGSRLGDASKAHQALADLGPCRPTAEQLARALGVNQQIASGLSGGWLDVCPQSIIWRCIGLANSIMGSRVTHQLASTATAIAA